MRSTITFIAILAAMLYFPETFNVWTGVVSMIVWFMHYLLDLGYATEGRAAVSRDDRKNKKAAL